jgi:rhodanese-related sulfurtransferase
VFVVHPSSYSTSSQRLLSFGAMALSCKAVLGGAGLAATPVLSSRRLRSNVQLAVPSPVALRTLRVQQAALRPRAVAVKAGVVPVGVEDAAKLVKEQGFSVVDVRDQTQFEKSHIKGSVHIPLFIVNEDTDPGTLLKRQAHNNFSGFLFGLAFTKPNPTFLEDVQKQFPNKDSKLLLVCQTGLRSTGAADELEDIGYTTLATLAPGLGKVKPGLFEKEGPRELKDAGKGGFVAIQTQFSVVLATILLGALLFIQFFPDTVLGLFPEAS